MSDSAPLILPSTPECENTERRGSCDAIDHQTQPSARTADEWPVCAAVWTKERSHLAPDHPVSFSLDVQTTREDAWDRDAIVRGFWVCPDSAWSGSRDRRPKRIGGC